MNPDTDNRTAALDAIRDRQAALNRFDAMSSIESSQGYRVRQQLLKEAARADVPFLLAAIDRLAPNVASAPIERAATDLLVRLSEHAEDPIMDAAEMTWPAELDDYIANVGTPRGQAHNERTFAAAMRVLAPKLIEAADAADQRADALAPPESGEQSVRVSDVQEVIARLRDEGPAGAEYVLNALESEINQLAGKAET